MRLAIVGVGLIGGSVGLAARERLQAEVSGYDASRDALAAALENLASAVSERRRAAAD